MRLYDLSHAYQNIWGLVENEDIDLVAIEMALGELETEITTKAGSLALIIKGMESDADIIKAEERRLADRRKALEGKVSWLKGYVREAMEAAGIDKVKTPTMTISLQNNPPAVQIVCPEAIPSRFMTIIPESYAIDKKAISAALKDGIEVSGAGLTVGKSLRIR